MRLDKRILRSPQAQALAGAIASAYVRLVRHGGSWRTEGGERPAALVREGRPFIVAFWHARLLMMPYAWPFATPFHMLISDHRDGRLISRTVAHFGIHTIAGSTSRGGSGALRELVKRLKAGEVVGITPDGPRGPRMRASEGALVLARLSGAPILPLAYSARRRRILGSWDRFLLPLPGPGLFLWGEPLTVPRDADAAAMDSLRLELEQRLIALTHEADSRFGHPAIPPAAPKETEAA